MDIYEDLLDGLSFNEIFIKYKNEINVIYYDQIQELDLILKSMTIKEAIKTLSRTFIVDDFKDFNY